LLISASLFIALMGQACYFGSSHQSHDGDYAPAITGLLIQNQTRASCNGEIVQWTVCFKNLRQGSFSISLQVWRKIESYSVLQKIGSNDKVLNGRGSSCASFSVNSQERIATKQGDYLGLVIPQNRSTTNIVYSASSSSVFISSDDTQEFVCLSDFYTNLFFNRELGISARIGMKLLITKDFCLLLLDRDWLKFSCKVNYSRIYFSGS